MAGTPPKPPPPTLAVGSSPPKAPPPAFAAGSSPPNPPPTTSDQQGQPSYEKLVEDFLRPRVVSGTCRVDFIHEVDVYSDDPDLLTSKYLPFRTDDGKQAWYFFTRLRRKGPNVVRMVATATGRNGRWHNNSKVVPVLSNGGNQEERIGECRTFLFKEDGKREQTERKQHPWRMAELRLDPNHGGQEASSSDLVLCKVYRSQNAEADDESPMAAAPKRNKADGETSAAPAVVAPGRKEADEEIGAETAAGLRVAGDKHYGAETVASSSPKRQKKADGESSDAATTREIFDDSRNPLEAAEEAEPEEPRDLREDTYKYNDLFPPGELIEADEEIGAQTAAGLRVEGDKHYGAQTVAASSSPGRQKKAEGESADAATTRQIFDDSRNRNPLDAADDLFPTGELVDIDGVLYEDLYGPRW